MVRRILIAASEASPFAKSGGLGDVIGSLPQELKKCGADVRVIMPKYSDIPEQFKEKMQLVARFDFSMGWRKQYCGILELEHNGVIFYFVDNEYYFKRFGYYGYGDDGERFSYFDIAVLEAIEHLDFAPEVIHCNDWHTGMIPILLEAKYRHKEKYASIRTVMTIHNLKYQGVFSKEIMPDLLELDWKYFNDGSIEYYQQVNFLKAGIVYANCVTTVSNSYVGEIQQPYFGEGLDGLLTEVNYKLKGIVNGIDYDNFNPQKDSAIVAGFSADTLDERKKNKLDLQKECGLNIDEGAPIIAIVSRLVGQKGMDLVEYRIEREILQQDERVQLVVIGTGEGRYENFFRYLENRYGQRVKAHIAFDEKLAKKVYAGADMFLMPSLYEPCGIGQLIAMRYGCLPIVRETGGLKDTVKPYNEFTKEGNGFSFANYDSWEMIGVLRNALNVYYNKQEDWQQLMKQAMECDFSWVESAKNYLDMYDSLVK